MLRDIKQISDCGFRIANLKKGIGHREVISNFEFRIEEEAEQTNDRGRRDNLIIPFSHGQRTTDD